MGDQNDKLHLPYWSLLTLAATTSALLIFLCIRSLRRARRGFCLSCGYDLRGSTGTCPECGAEIAGRVRSKAEPWNYRFSPAIAAGCQSTVMSGELPRRATWIAGF